MIMKLNMIINIANRVALGALTALTALIAVGCGAQPSITGDQAKLKASAFVTGETLSVAAGFDAGILLWDVKVRAANKAVLIVSFMEASGDLYGIDDPAGPFDYELPRPQPDFLTYTEARARAMTSKTGAVIDWNLRYKPEGFRYEFYVRDAGEQLWEIKLDAKSGLVTSSVAVAAVD